MINIIKKEFPLHKDILKSEGFSPRLHVINAKGVLDDNGFKAIKKLNSIRNDLQHKYEFDLESMKEKIKALEELSKFKPGDFDRFTIIGQLQLICVPYINALRSHLGKIAEKLKPGLIIYHIDTKAKKWTLRFQSGGELKPIKEFKSVENVEGVDFEDLRPPKK